MSLRSRLLALVTLAITLAAGSARAYPTLQLDIKGGVYDTASETVFATSNSFALYAYLIPASNATLTDNYFLAMALMPSSSAPAIDGSFSFSSVTPLGSGTVGSHTVNVTGDMNYGYPPLETVLGGAGFDPGDLASHGVFPDYYYEQKFNFSSSNHATAYDTQTSAGLGPTTSGTGMYYAKFDVNLSGLKPGYGIHFDLYNESLVNTCKAKSCTVGDIDVNQFAPFSHDAQGMVTTIPEPETYAMLLAGLGLLGFQARRRSKT